MFSEKIYPDVLVHCSDVFIEKMKWIKKKERKQRKKSLQSNEKESTRIKTGKQIQKDMTARYFAF